MTRTAWLTLAAMVAHPGATIVVVTYPPERHKEMTTTTATPRPDARVHGLGELIRAHRLYVGMSQREMARRLGFDRRDYQRIESGQNACPVGFLSRVEAVSDEFAHDVDLLIEEAERRGGLALSYSVDSTRPASERDEWYRLVAGRAAVEATEGAPITLKAVSGHAGNRTNPPSSV